MVKFLKNELTNDSAEPMDADLQDDIGKVYRILKGLI